MSAREAREMVRRCEAAGCCPLGAALASAGGVEVIAGIGREDARHIATWWDGDGTPKDRLGSMLLARRLLGPRILAGLARIEGEA